MKMTKKLLIGAAALVAAMGLMSCGGIGGDDDPNKMITGKGSAYSIDYTNETGDASRGYKDTAQKHAGALVKITIDPTSNDPTRKSGGIMGIVFGLDANEEEKKARDFYVFGVRKSNQYYISKYEGVTDIQERNFGAKDGDYAGNGATETVVVDFDKVYKNADTVESVYFYFVNNDEGNFEYKLLSSVPTEKVKGLSDKEFKALEFEESTVLASGTLPTNYGQETQRKLAVYANVYKDGTLIGNWDIIGTYKEADVIEE